MKLYKYFSENRTTRWIDIINQLVDGLNARVHRITLMRPCDVTEENSDILRDRLKYLISGRKRRKPKFKVGDMVRITKSKHVFEKGYLPTYTEEIFSVSKVLTKQVPHTYFLRDMTGEDLKGHFYEPELSYVIITPDSVYPVEKVLKTRTRDGIKQYFVKFKGWDSRFNAWVNGFI